MAKVILGNHFWAVFAARSQKERIRRFYCDVLGCKARVTNDEVDRFQLDDVHFIFVWQSTVAPVTCPNVDEPSVVDMLVYAR